jgi:hypothetical protein
MSNEASQKAANETRVARRRLAKEAATRQLKRLANRPGKRLSQIKKTNENEKDAAPVPRHLGASTVSAQRPTCSQLALPLKK